jgi:hypothetical protein
MRWAKCRGMLRLLAMLALLGGRDAVHAQQQVKPGPAAPQQAPVDLQIQLTLPTADQLFRPESEATARARAQEQALRQHAKTTYPPDAPPDMPTQGPHFRCMPPQLATVVADVICHNPLYFEAQNTERYGWRVPFAQPVLSTGRFYLDTLLLPCNVIVRPPWTLECHGSSPKPGDPVPYHFYLFSWTQTTGAAAANCGASTCGTSR